MRRQSRDVGIRGDAEARFWADMGREKPREMVIWFFECLKDPTVWQRMQRELEMTAPEIGQFFLAIDWLKENMVTRAETLTPEKIQALLNEKTE